MTGHDDFDRTLAGWFEADALSPAPAGGLDRVLDATRRRRPRPAWLAGPGSHWVGDGHLAPLSGGIRSLPRLRMRWSTALILLLALAALVGGAILMGARLLQSSPRPTERFGLLAYGTNRDMYLAQWDGKSPTRITQSAPVSPGSCGGFGAEGTIWSPDGQHLAYRGCGTVFISDPSGHVVASFPGNGWLVSWSPDSTGIATWIEGSSQTIGIYGLEGARQARLTVPTGYSPPGDFDPVWSRDGASLLIDLSPPAPTQDPGQVWELPVDGRTPRPVPADDPRSQESVAYSPDGARVAFMAERKQPGPFLLPAESLVVAAADGSQERILVSGGVQPGGLGSVVWSPTGDRIAFAVTAAGTQPGAPLADELRLVNVANGTVTSLAKTRGTDSLHAIRFSATGDRILFSRTDSPGEPSLWSVRADGLDAQLLVMGTWSGDWQPLPAGP